MTQMSYYKIF